MYLQIVLVLDLPIRLIESLFPSVIRQIHMETNAFEFSIKLYLFWQSQGFFSISLV